MAITQVGIPFINKNKLDLFLNYTIVEVGNVEKLTVEESNNLRNALDESIISKLSVLIIGSLNGINTYIYIVQWDPGSGPYMVYGVTGCKSTSYKLGFWWSYVYANSENDGFVDNIPNLNGDNTFTKSNIFTGTSNVFNNKVTFGEDNQSGVGIVFDKDNDTLKFQFNEEGLHMTLDCGSSDGQIITTENIASNVANKVDKLKNNSTTTSKVYAVYPNTSTPVLINSSSSESPTSLVWRNPSGKANIETPTDSDSVKAITNVEYVKNYVTNNSSKLTVTDNEDGTLTLSF